MPGMRRREFVSLFGGAAATWPLRGARAAAGDAGGRISLLRVVPELSTGIVAAFRKGLGEAGFVEGRNVMVEFRFAYNDNARLPEMVAELVRRRVAVIVTLGSTPAALAAKAATTSIPVVFSVGTDPVEFGLRRELQPPGRERHRDQLPELRGCGQAARAATRAAAEHRALCRAGQSKQS